MNRRAAWIAGAAILMMATGAVAQSAQLVLDWNDELLQAVRVDKSPPPKASRTMAIVQVSIFDAVNALAGGFETYFDHGPAPGGASPDATVVGAAHKALVALFPAQASTFDAARATALAAIPDGAAKTAGISWGETVAGQILGLRANDGAAATVSYTPPIGALWWLPTPPAFAPALLPNWPTVTPWTMDSGAQFRQGPPPSSTSPEYASAFAEVRRLGRVNSPVRTPEQTQIALFWADGGGTTTPPGHWNVIAQGLAKARGLNGIQTARLLALLDLAEADAAIVSWDHKYAYHHWRPVTGIQGAGADGNPATAADAGWAPLIATPPFPAYTSGHSTFSSAAAAILAHFFGSDQADFSTTSDGLPGVTRSYSSFSAAAAEAGQSRIYGGIHWQYDNQAGLTSGRRLGEHVFFGFLGPLGSPGTCASGPTTLCLGSGGRFKVEAAWKTANASGPAQVMGSDGDSGRFYFFAPDNTELTVKVLDGCSLGGHYWVFASGLTNVELIVTVTDTNTGHSRRYFNPAGRAFAPVQDTSAFSCQ